MTTPLTHFEADEVYTAVPTAPSHRIDTRDPGFLYALQFESGLVKVGRAVRLRDRVTIHRKNLREDDGEFVRGWASPAHLNYVETEKMLIASGHALASHWRGVEYLYGAELDDLAEAAGHLTYELLPPVLPPMHGPELPGLMATHDFAKLIGVPRDAIRRWMTDSDVFCRHMGSRRYVPRVEVERVLHGVQVSRRTRVPASEVNRVLEKEER